MKYRGNHYYYFIDIDDETVPHNLLAFLSSEDEAATVRFYAEHID